ncbi:MAG TPA: bifunctional hydroxymethylpyrimidine kinase/phosphomethylpyrimidine kinase [Pyrinomonadaceae bacterium]|nr:bifunctional hydroxymethylpyrimidine kinase/phosphomethylpyrimidine kinase [Pyrinomonadaceae bacterium]
MNGKEKVTAPITLTIAGFDPSGGAGTIADIKTFTAFGCTPSAAITSLTFQNARGVWGATHQTAETVREQVMAIVAESSIAAVKTGMLPTPEIVREVARLFRETRLPAPVVDPVSRSTSGYELMEEDAIKVLLAELMPLARVITPNIPEAETLTGLRIENEKGMREAAIRLREMGARAVMIKGGHGPMQWSEVSGQRSVRGSSPTVREGSAQAIDLLDDEGHVTVFSGEWIDSLPVRGTGCMLSSAIAACLAKGLALEEAVSRAKEFVAHAILDSKLQTQN